MGRAGAEDAKMPMPLESSWVKIIVTHSVHSFPKVGQMVVNELFLGYLKTSDEVYPMAEIELIATATFGLSSGVAGGPAWAMMM